MMTWMIKALSTTLDHKKVHFKVIKDTDSIRVLIHSVRSYCILYVLGFCNQVLPDLQRALKWRTFRPTIVNQVVGVSHVLGFVHVKKFSTRSSPIGYWSKGSIVGWCFGIVQGSDEIFYTYNRLFLISGFLGMVIWNSLRRVFALWEVFPIN